jgi:hypothetical protein
MCISRKKIFTSFLLYYFLFTQYLYADQTMCHVSMVISNATSNIASTAPLPARLGRDITPQPMSPWQRHRQQDSTATSRHDQRRLSNAISTMTWRGITP